MSRDNTICCAWVISISAFCTLGVLGLCWVLPVVLLHKEFDCNVKDVTITNISCNIEETAGDTSYNIPANCTDLCFVYYYGDDSNSFCEINSNISLTISSIKCYKNLPGTLSLDDQYFSDNELAFIIIFIVGGLIATVFPMTMCACP